jgi:hypothetical protein
MKRQASYTHLLLVIVGLLVIELLTWAMPAAAADTPGTWKLTGNMLTARRHAASATLPDGKILVVGGTNTTGVDGTASVFYNSAEIYDPATGTWTATGSLTTGGRALHRATRLTDGTILITGGWNGTSALSTAEIYTYNPATGTGTFAATAGLMTTVRAAPSSVRLFGGQVLITGGFDSSGNPLASAEIYNPATGAFSATASMTAARSHHRSNTVGPGNVFITGGYGAGGVELSSTELFTPGSNPAITGTFTAADSLTQARANHSAVELPTGEILVTGGHGGGGVLASTEIYNPDTNEFTAGPDLNHARQGHGSGVLPNGVVLIGGGNNNSSSDWDIQTNFLPSNELYDPATPSTFTLTISKFAVTGGGTSAGLWTGKMLATTGLTNQAELYTPVMPGTLQTWELTTNMVTARINAMWYLLDDGRALIVGGLDSAGNPLASAEVYDYLTGNFASTGSMGTPRHHHHGAALYTGKALVMGGRPSATANVLNSAELYDPASGTFTPTGDMLRYRRLHKATGLRNGKVLITGGLGGTSNTAGGFLSSAELYDPATGTFAWTTGGPAVGLNTARYNHQAIVLYTGKVLIAGGVGSGTPSNVLLKSAELYDPKTDTFATTGDMITARNSPLLTQLPDGKILVSNGHNSVTGTTGAPIQSIEIYDPATGTFTAAGNTLVARHGNRVTRLDNGKTIFVGGQTTADPTPSVTDSAELYNHVTGSFSDTDNLNTARRNFAQWSLPNGKILVAGGYDASATVLSSAELYTPLIADEVDTTITFGPDAVTTSTSATFTFTSDPAGGTFNCSLDNAAFAPCTSPKIYNLLADGNHNFQVQATSGGITDPTPANYDWSINPVQLFTLTIFVSPVGGGTVGLVPSGGTYGSGTPVALTANASAGYRFDHWEGDLTGTANPAQITMNSSKSVTAVFIQQFTLNIAVLPAGGGTVSLAPPGGTYDSGTPVTLTPIPNAGSFFRGWTGCTNSQGARCNVTMNANQTLTANFEAINISGFNDVPLGYWADDYVYAIFQAGVTVGCGAPNYCPVSTVSREQMAAFLVRAVEKGQFFEGPCLGQSPFNDVPQGSNFCRNIERLVASGITRGCVADDPLTPGNEAQYCPSSPVTREQMAAFIVRTVEGGQFYEGQCTGPSPFTDVLQTSLFCRNIERLKAYNPPVTRGCTVTEYCPGINVLRDQMAAFLARAFLGMP